MATITTSILSLGGTTSTPSVITATISNTSIHPSSTASNTNNSNNNSNNGFGGSSFVGNTPSTVLFFLALAVGVFIALLFVFFTVRYFVRSKYGLHVYPISRRNLIATSGLMSSDRSHLNDNITNEELQEQLEYIRDNHFIQNEFLQSRINGRHRRRRRRRGRYSRMKKLSEEEVEILFPKKSYYDWLHGGKERDHEKRDGILHEEGLESRDTAVAVTKEEGSSNLNSDLHNISSLNDENTNDESLEMQEMKSSAATDTSDDDLHFTSGSCAICLEIMGDEDVVRGLICGHVFHAECLDPWLTKRRACCPMCKRDYFFKKDSQARNEDGAAAESTPENANEQSDSVSNNNIAGETDRNENDNTNADNENTTANANAEDDDDDDDISIDFDALRSNPALRALLSELVPISERVRLVLNDEQNNHLNLEERGREAAKKQYGIFFKVLWWKLMGIRKEDLFNWAVLNIYTQYRREQAAAAAAAAEEETTTPTNENDDASNSQEPDSPEIGADGDGSIHSSNDRTSSHSLEEVDIADANNEVSEETRRETVEQRV